MTYRRSPLSDIVVSRNDVPASTSVSSGPSLAVLVAGRCVQDFERAAFARDKSSVLFDGLALAMRDNTTEPGFFVCERNSFAKALTALERLCLLLTGSPAEESREGVESFPTRRIISTREDRQLEMQRSETERTARGESTPKARGGRKQR